MNNKANRQGPPVEKAKDFKGTVKKLIKYLKPYHKIIFTVMFFAILSTIFNIVGPKIQGNAITEIFNGLIAKLTNTGGIDFKKLGTILLILVGLYVCSALFSYIQGFIMSGVTQKVTYKMRKEVSEKLHRLPMSYFDKKNNGEILSTIVNDIETISQNLNQVATQFITSIVTIIGVFIMMLSINISMTFITLLILPISSILILGIASKSQKYFMMQQDYLASVNDKVEEMYGGHNVIKAFTAEDKFIKKFDEENNKLFEVGLKSQFLAGMMHPIMNFVSNLSYVGVSIIGGYFVIKGKIQVGSIQSFIQYSRNFTNPIAQIAQISNMLQAMIAGTERVFEFLESEEEPSDVKTSYDLSTIKGNVTFNHVKFGYNSDKMIIKDFSANIKAGQKVAIVGPTGAGKTTMVKLLMRFYNVSGGEILIDGKNVNDFKRSDLRNIFGMVLQDTWLFTGTIMENLRYGKLDASDDEVIEAAKKVGVHHFIQTLPDSYNMVLNEEADNVSGGQKQLLTIARAVLADPKVLILDEATSNVDTRTEVLIQQAMDELMKGRTSFIIAHRLSTIKNADLILVMNEGNIIEQGTHEELLAKNGFYANLYNSQFETLE